MKNPLNGNERLEALIEQTAINNGPDSFRDSQVKGRVLTFMGPVSIQIGYGFPRPGFEVKQVMDGVVTSYKTFISKLEAADEYAMLRAHARRNMHAYLSSVRPESSYKE
jgi:hypothetical protein